MLAFSKNIKGQFGEDRNVVKGINVNLLGNASIASISYERNYIVKEKLTVAGSLGLGFNTEYRFCFGGCSSPSNKYLTIPHFITGNLGKKKEFFEFGVGGTFLFGKGDIQYLPFPIIGYRLQSLQHNNSYFRFMLSVPFYGWGKTEVFFSPVGISMGKSF